MNTPLTSIRLFVSSTFRDMQAEREELVKVVFPEVRKLCAERGISWTEVDLRWGITREQAESGALTELCLAEVDRCRPFFLCMLGERYGHQLKPEFLPAGLRAKYPASLAEGASLTELEIRHAVLDAVGGEPVQALFYFRDPAWPQTLPVEARALYDESPTPEELEKYGAEEAERRSEARRDALKTLKQRIRGSGHSVVDGYRNPVAFRERVAADLKALIDRVAPAGTTSLALDRSFMQHEVFARARRDYYFARRPYFDKLNEYANSPSDGKGLLVVGEAGCGKSSLLANWLEERKSGSPDDTLVVYHALGAAPDSTAGEAILKRLLGELHRKTGVPGTLPEKPEVSRQTFLQALAGLKSKVVLVLDNADRVDPGGGFREMLWLPGEVPQHLKLIVGVSDGRVADRLEERNWHSLRVEPLTVPERRVLVEEVLQLVGKSLSAAQAEKVASAVPCQNALFLRLLLDELRIFGSYEGLDGRIDYYLAPTDAAGTQQPAVTDLFSRILARYENDYERDRPGLVRDAMSAIWASRHGLEEHELLVLLGQGSDQPMPQAYWTPLSLAAEGRLLLMAGRISIAYAGLREAIEARYLENDELFRKATHRKLADYFSLQETVVGVSVRDQAPASGEIGVFRKLTDARVIFPRQVEELPWQLIQSGDWLELARKLQDVGFLEEAWKVGRDDVETYWRLLYENSPYRIPDAYRYVLDNPAQYARHLDRVSLLLVLGGYREEAISLLRHEVNIARDEKDDKELARLLGPLANHYRRLEKLDEAWALYDEQEKLSRTLHDTELLATALGGKAMIARRRKQFPTALELHREEEKCARISGRPAVLAGALNNQALALDESGAPAAEQLVLRRQVERLARELNDSFLLVHTLIPLARLEMQSLGPPGEPPSEEWFRAICGKVYPCFDEALHVATTNQMTKVVEDVRPRWTQVRKICVSYAQTLTARGVRLYEARNYNDAARTYEEAEEVYRRIGDERGVGICLGERALVLMSNGQYDVALGLLAAEEQICRRLHDNEGLAVCLGNQAGLLLQADRLIEAAAKFDQQERECPDAKDTAVAERRAAGRAWMAKQSRPR